MPNFTINIARDFSRTPAGRYRSDGRFSGQVFREDVLLPKLNAGHVTVEMDDVEGYGSSFLEEAFGGLVRIHHLRGEELRKRLTIVAKSPGYSRFPPRVWKYVAQAEEDQGKK